MTPSIACILPLALTGAILVMPAPAAANAHFTIVINDGPPRASTTRRRQPRSAAILVSRKGQQRLIAFQFAADLWGAALDSNVEITIRASFDPLAANVLGSAGAGFKARMSTTQ